MTEQLYHQVSIDIDGIVAFESIESGLCIQASFHVDSVDWLLRRPNSPTTDLERKSDLIGQAIELCMRMRFNLNVCLVLKLRDIVISISRPINFTQP